MMCPQCGQPFWSPSLLCPRCGFMQPSLRKEQGLAKNHGMILQGDTYHLEEQQERRQWSPDISETWWRAYDKRNRSRVLISEVDLSAASTLPAFIASAQKALIIGDHLQRLPLLLDVFMERSHGFFVFADIPGDTLAARIRQGAILQEPEAASFLHQLAEVLQACAQQNPPMVHGAIQPGHIKLVGKTSWVLTHCSVLSAGRIWHYLPQMERSANQENREGQESLDPSFHPTVVSDLSDLSAAAYFAVTRSVAPIDGHVQSFTLRNAGISPAFAAIIQKGIHAREQERYHAPSELLHALSLFNVPERSAGSIGSARSGRGPHSEEDSAHDVRTSQEYKNWHPLTSSFPSGDARGSGNAGNTNSFDDFSSQARRLERHEGGKALLLAPDELSPVPSRPHRADLLAACLWSIGIVGCALVLLFMPG